MKKLWCVVVLFVCLLSGCSCKKVEKASIFSSYIKAYYNKDGETYTLVSPFGTYISLVAYDKSKLDDIEEEFNELVYKYHSLLDRNYYYRDKEGKLINNIKVINDSYGSGNSVVVDKIVIDILKEGIKYSKLSGGKFNIFAGSIVDVWEEKFVPFNTSDPDEKDINEAMKCVLNVQKIDDVFVIDEISSSVTFNSFEGCSKGASITLGALAKSFFLDEISKLENFKGLESAIYDAGQSSIIIRGSNPTRKNGEWLVGVKDSLNGGNGYQLKIENDNAISTSSGDYKSYINDEGIRRHHIIDAVSGYPNNNLLAVTVVGESAMIVDIITTTLMAMNIDEIKIYLSVLQDLEIDIAVALQIAEGENLKILANDKMRAFIGEVYCDAQLEEFNYGA